MFHMKTAVWQIEWWQPGQTFWRHTLGSGLSDVFLHAIHGNAAGHPLAGADEGADYVRAALLSILTEAQLSSTGIGAVDETPAGANHSLDDHLYHIILKQRGAQAPHLPVSVTFPQPVRVPMGQMVGYLDIQTYQSGGVVPTPAEALDAEYQLTLLFEQAA